MEIKDFNCEAAEFDLIFRSNWIQVKLGNTTIEISEYNNKIEIRTRGELKVIPRSSNSIFVGESGD